MLYRRPTPNDGPIETTTSQHAGVQNEYHFYYLELWDDGSGKFPVFWDYLRKPDYGRED